MRERCPLTWDDGSSSGFQQPDRMDTSQVRLFHAPGKTHAIFDDEQVIAYSGLLAAMRLAERCGLADLVGDSVAIGDRDGGNAAAKVGGIVAGRSRGAADKRLTGAARP